MSEFICLECGALLEHDDINTFEDRGDLQTPASSHWQCPLCPSESITEIDYTAVAEMLKVLSVRVNGQRYAHRSDFKNLSALAEIIGEILP